MNAKWIYIFALSLLLVLRVVVMNTEWDAGLANAGFAGTAHAIAVLRVSPPFLAYIGNWALPVFVVTAVVYWMTDTDSDIAKQFLLLPIAYVPFSIVGTILQTAEFHLAYLYIHPLVILPFGYVYVVMWWALVWVLGKVGIVQQYAGA